MAGAGWVIRPPCSRAWQMASTAGYDGSPSNRSLLTGVAPIVLLEMNSRAHPATSGPNIGNAMGAQSTMLAAMSPSTSNSSLSNAHGKCRYFLPNPLTRQPTSCQ
uniref:Uncharacterized protein n=1 Tax=Romanomermis culicivorax TaxID=13658 RepID=A0A915ICK0_ROMCU